MLKKAILYSLLLIVIGACGKSTKTKPSSETLKKTPPNILVLFTDDQRYGTINALDMDHVQTPNMDKLVKDGTYFSNTYIFGSPHGAVCSPSRAMLMTGRPYFNLPEKTYATWAYPPKERGNCDTITFPEFFRQKGYHTFTTGKQHNGKYWVERGFETVKAAFMGGMSKHFGTPINDFNAQTGWSKTYSFKDTFSSEVFANAAVNYLDQYQDETPFLMYVSFTSPHDPRTAPPAYHQKYPPSAISLPPNFMPQHPFPIADMHIRDEELAAFPRTKTEIQKNIADYYAMISATDAQIGRILETLKKTGKDKNTIIVFAADNGLALGQHGLMGKQSLYEHSIKVPLCFVGPNIPKNVKKESLAYLHDLFPTLTEMSGFETPKTVQSSSLVPIIAGQKHEVHEALHFGYNSWRLEKANKDYPKGTTPKGSLRAVRQGDWKLILSSKDDVLTKQLFNLKKDPWELNNLANKPKYHDRLEKLTLELKKLIQQSGDPAKLNKPYFGLYDADLQK